MRGRGYSPSKVVRVHSRSPLPGSSPKKLETTRILRLSPPPFKCHSVSDIQKSQNTSRNESPLPSKSVVISVRIPGLSAEPTERIETNHPSTPLYVHLQSGSSSCRYKSEPKTRRQGSVQRLRDRNLVGIRDEESRGKRLERAGSDKVESRTGVQLYKLENSAMEDNGEIRKRLIQGMVEHYAILRKMPRTTSEYYQPIQMIGTVASGKVTLSIHRLTGKRVAIKSIEKSQLKSVRIRQKVFQEVVTLTTVKHPHILRLLEVFESAKHFNLVYEYCPGGNLLLFMREKGALGESEAKQLFYQIIEAVNFCHSRGVVHRDIKLDNILLSEDQNIVKLSAFGLSRVIENGQKLTDHCGTQAYQAPEIIADQGYDGFAADLWSLGVLLYALLTGSVPFQASTTTELQKLILKGKYPVKSDLSKEAKSVLSGLLNLIPKKRIPLQILGQHPWFRRENDSFLYFKDSGFGEEPEFDLDEKALDGLKTAGLSRAYIITCLRGNYTNHATATYELMQMHGLSGL